MSNSKMTDSDKITAFLKTHDLISLNALEKRCSIPQGTLSKAVTGVRNISENHIQKLSVELKKYGY